MSESTEVESPVCSARRNVTREESGDDSTAAADPAVTARILRAMPANPFMAHRLSGFSSHVV